MKHQKISVVSLGLAAALALSACAQPGEVPTVESEVISAASEDAVSVAITASNVPYEKRATYIGPEEEFHKYGYDANLGEEMTPTSAEMDYQEAANRADAAVKALGYDTGTEPWSVSYYAPEAFYYGGGQPSSACGARMKLPGWTAAACLCGWTVLPAS